MNELWGTDAAAAYDANDDPDHDPGLVDAIVGRLVDLAGDGTVVEYAIGTGRVGLPLSRRGIDVAGIDSSPAMLDVLRSKPGADRLTLVEGDMTSASAGTGHALVVLVFNGITNLLTQREQVACFHNAARHLRPGGRFVVEVFVPQLRRLAPGDRHLPFDVGPDHLGFDEYDVVTQRLTSHHVRVHAGVATTSVSPHRYVWPAELDLMADVAGFELEHRWADWDRSPFDATSASHVSVYRRRNAPARAAVSRAGGLCVALGRSLDDAIATIDGFSGVVGVEAVGVAHERRATGWADRAHRIPMTVDHRIGIASGTKTLTALTVLSCVDDGLLALDQPVRSVLGTDLALVDDRVTVEMLLRHRSGIGDYLDENDDGLDVLDHVMRVPLHTLDGADGYLAAIDGYPQDFEPGTEFAYCNSGYVVLAILAERVTGDTFAEALTRRVVEPVGLRHTGFERMDSLPGDCAVGYTDATGLRTNVLHLPVLGSGDGGAFTTVDDVQRLWRAMLDGPLRSSFERMRSPHPGDGRYGMGLWLDTDTGEAAMEGMDPGASFRSTYSPSTDRIVTVLSNTTHGAWAVDRALRGVVFASGS